ncbi:hypothetical protein PUR29_32985 [Methylobacterium ajmalii]|uniref:Uncharacterized protein n=1 Tax=Methylobacterium ajmalii TaxID=2738439 RepID=A0ABV0A528_9HYPH
MRHISLFSGHAVSHLRIIGDAVFLDATTSDPALRRVMREERTKLTRRGRRERIAAKEAFLRGAL